MLASEFPRTTIDIPPANDDLETYQTIIRTSEANAVLRFPTLISRSLWAGAVLTVLLVISGGLWGILHAVRDGAGAAGAKGVFLVVGACWFLDFVTLVVLTAVCQLRQTETEEETTDPSRSIS